MISTYSHALAVSNVPDDDEWRLQRERLLGNVHNSIKQVQNEASELPDISTPLQIKDLPVQQLCQQLDLIFLHGLRHIANGYWLFVREFTHKASVDFILTLQNVHSNIGRGRAWLYSTLNESSLESYIRSFSANSVLIDQYYIQQAFLRDEQRLQMLGAIVAGLEYVPFQLEMDLPFLDECIIPNAVILRKDSSLSSISLTSSILSQQSSASLESIATSQDGDSGFGTMENSQLHVTENGKRQPNNFKMDERIARILGMDFSDNHSTEITEDGLESIQVLTRSGRTRRQKKSKPPLNGLTSPVMILQPLPNGTTTTKPEENLSSSDTTPTDTKTPEFSEPEHEAKEVKSAIKLRDKSGERKNPAKRVSFEIDLVANDVNMNYYSNGCSENGTPVNDECGDGVFNKSQDGDGGECADEEFRSIYDAKFTPVRKGKTKKCKSGFKGLTLKLDKEDFSEQSRRFDEKMKSEMMAKCEMNETHNIKVDNNTLLKLMISVFSEENETLFKMFYATIGHSEDKIKLVFLVLTDRKLYLIEHGLCQRHYFVSKVIDYEELDLLLLGLNYQTIHIYCKWKKRRYMLCTGNENLTKSIVSNLEIAVRRCCGSKHVPNVCTNPWEQTITIKRWIAKETNSEPENVKLLHYALVHWEDPQSPESPQCPAGPAKDGHLMFRFYYQEPSNVDLSDLTWTPGYFVLRAGVLYQFSDRESYELQMYTRLHSPDFRGCRRVNSSNRPHVFELRLDVGKFLHLAAADDYEASQWMQAFLETIAYKNLDENPRVFRACSLVLTPEILFVCEEEFEFPACISACLTLGSAQLKDINKVMVDAEEARYCILEFEQLEANVCSGDWIIYFSSELELEKFFVVLDDAWQKLFQIPSEKTQITNKSIQQKCRDRVEVLQNSWKLGYDMLREPIAVIENYASPK